MPSADDDTQLVPLTLTDANHPDPDTLKTMTLHGRQVDETRPHPNKGGNPSIPYGTVQMTRKPRNAEQRASEPDRTLYDLRALV